PVLETRRRLPPLNTKPKHEKRELVWKASTTGWTLWRHRLPPLRNSKQGKNGVSHNAGATITNVIRQLPKLGTARSGQEGASMQ
ncbi:unnamed protein product, partial [Ectocarpus fasciculatus]